MADPTPETPADGQPVAVVLVGQGGAPAALLAAAEALVGKLPRVRAVNARDQLAASAAELDDGRGVLFVVDLLGSSEARQALELARGRQGAVVGGLSLAMLLKLATAPRESAHELGLALAATGRKAIEVLL
jgi:PTS system mannose-specific IIA component